MGGKCKSMVGEEGEVDGWGGGGSRWLGGEGKWMVGGGGCTTIYVY